MASNPSLGWERLQDVYYRLRECYDLKWEKQISLNLVSLSSLASFIACFPKSTFHNDNLMRSIEIFSGAGNLITSIPWLRSNGKIVALGWSFLNEDETLILILENGIIRQYYNFENDFNEINLALSENEMIREVKFFINGCVLKLNNDKFISVSNYSKPVIRMLNFDNDENDKIITTWTVLPPNVNNNLQVILSYNNTINSISVHETIKNLYAEEGKFEFISFSPNRDFVAIYTTTKSCLTILTSDFKHKLTEFQSDNTNRPTDVKWCSNDVVVVAYKDELKLIGPSPTESLNFYYNNSELILLTELDGLKILSNNKLEFLSRINDITVDTFRFGSTSPSAILLDSVDQLDRHSPKVDENLKIIENSLIEAIDHCIVAASEEFDPYWQKKLLRAASFGKLNLQLYNPEEFVEMCNNLKILNNVRSNEVGLFLTYQEYLSLGFENLIKRLLKLNFYYLSKQISKFNNFPLNLIYIDWACKKIKILKNSKDEELFEVIINNLKKNLNLAEVSFQEIAKVAYEQGRLKLSILLLNYEPIPERQIPLLLEFEQDDIALLKADESGNSDLIYYVLITLKNKLSLAQFFKTLNNKSISIGIFKEKFYMNNDKLLENFYYQDDNLLEISNLELKEYYENYKSSSPGDGIEDIIQKIQTERKTFVKTLNIYDKLLSSSKATLKSYYSEDIRLIEAHLSLLNLQESLTKEYEMDFYTDCKTLDSLLVKLISINQISKIFKIIKTFKINEKKLYYLILKSLIKQHKFDKLLELVKTESSGSSTNNSNQFFRKRSLIDFKFIINELIKLKNFKEADLYINMSNLTYHEKVRYYLSTKNLKKAAEEAFNQKDVKILNVIYDNGNSSVQRMVNDCLQKLGQATRT
ncbi:hypothetical protein PACTADRAFT_47539 [Pachysolen tannophilus NRRL Y-2460]|uniref:Probable vacuolar protein sorting-associated protein 16 homolog n=1 Tax=Pachysolen tannophilus NRRL Y-2460 TaxID=669874 RepID=A0A1E4U160_PACTA|nr:hypothetical protein PACTADRAFT_47539 [Pachysolen tannophilus NRRL Y-2460]